MGEMMRDDDLGPFAPDTDEQRPLAVLVEHYKNRVYLRDRIAALEAENTRLRDGIGQARDIFDREVVDDATDWQRKTDWHAVALAMAVHLDATLADTNAQ